MSPKVGGAGGVSLGSKMSIYQHEFIPFYVTGLGSNERRIVAAEPAWREPVAWNREAACTCVLDKCKGALGHVPGACPQHQRPLVRLGCDLFDEWDGPILNGEGLGVFWREPPFPRYWDTQQPDDDEWTFEHSDQVTLQDVRTRFFAECPDACPNLDWLVETRHPENVRRMWKTWPTGSAPDGSDGRGSGTVCVRNIILLARISTQAEADTRIPELLKCRDLAGKLGVIADGSERLTIPFWNSYEKWANGGGTMCEHGITYGLQCNECDKINFVTIRGDIGPDAKPCNIEHVRDLMRQCDSAGVEFRIERLGASVVDRVNNLDQSRFWPRGTKVETFDATPGMWHLTFKDPTGSDPAEWPEDLQEFKA